MPLIVVFLTSFFDRGTYGGINFVFNFKNYERLFDSLYLKIYYQTIKLSLLTSFICWIMALPIAWTIATAKKNLRNALIIGMAIPFLTNLVVRLYAINSAMGPQGFIAMSLIKIIPQFDPYLLSQNKYLTAFGMVFTYLPFMVYALYVAFDQFDFTQIEAALDLGAFSPQILIEIILPQLKPASLSGFILVFVPCLGEYLIPDLLGGAKVMLLGNLLSEQFLKARDWPFGSAIGVLNLIVVGIIIVFIEARGRRLKWKN